MPKKVAAAFTNVGNTIYAVLSPGNGFLKEVYGDVEFTDALPRASGSFNTREEAIDAWKRSIERARSMTEEARTGRSEYFLEKAKRILSQAHNAIIVKMTVESVL